MSVIESHVYISIFSTTTKRIVAKEVDERPCLVGDSGKSQTGRRDRHHRPRLKRVAVSRIRRSPRRLRSKWYSGLLA
ncbi:malate dehydrogenase [Anopheles sinensis]|uniref:Malate dehydrogenase n=1 Tax=Anopheles sinensis TaxID=74873 RepID=A0A084WP76_ANOSI|nr:malate dehydrogenase [Anopheles sinensis]